MKSSKSIESNFIWFAVVIVIGLLILLLNLSGRPWICECGYVRFWLGDIGSGENSKHFLDPYSFTHIQHGLVFMLVLGWLFRKLAVSWRLLAAVIIESVWELVENSSMVIESYQKNSISMGYTGDTIINSLGDVTMCTVGFILATKFGWKKTVLLFVVIELLMLVTIRDSLLLNIVMPYFPIESVLKWQQGG